MAFDKADPRDDIVAGMIRGQSLTQIAEQMGDGWTSEKVHQVWWDYLDENYSSRSEIEMRFLSLARLERMMDKLWNQVEAGDFATEGRTTANVIKIIEKINELMALNKDPLKEAQVELTKAQTQYLHGMLVELRMSLLSRVVSSLMGLELPDAVAERLRTEVEAQWSTWYHDASQEALQLAASKESETV